MYYKDDDKDKEPGLMSEKAQARKRAQEKVQSTIRKFRYQNYIRSGLDPIEAAKRMGVKISPYDRLEPYKILEKIEKGK